MLQIAAPVDTHPDEAAMHCPYLTFTGICPCSEKYLPIINFSAFFSFFILPTVFSIIEC